MVVGRLGDFPIGKVTSQGLCWFQGGYIHLQNGLCLLKKNLPIKIRYCQVLSPPPGLIQWLYFMTHVNKCLNNKKANVYPPIPSMYGISTYIYHENQRNVGKYIIHGCYGPRNLRLLFGGGSWVRQLRTKKQTWLLGNMNGIGSSPATSSSSFFEATLHLLVTSQSFQSDTKKAKGSKNIAQAIWDKEYVTMVLLMLSDDLIQIFM